ncbi:MAG: hypothetical protein IT320_01235 [Anaerolineae bacterium]|nr:hypothetical protein [Anaerolineae bacterium]
MFWLISRIRRDFASWERPTRLGFLLAIGLLVVAIVLFFIAPDSQRQTVIIGIGALIIVTQIIVMWGNRGMMSPLTQAQRAFLRGDLDVVLAHLEPLHESGQVDVRGLTLLGNTYRQLGRLEESAAVLSEAVDNSPIHHFPLYGFGRTLIVQGHYAEGTTFVERALEAGAPAIVRFDLAEAYYRQGQIEALMNSLADVDVTDEPQRQLFMDFWRWRFAGAQPPERSLIETGLPFWQGQAERFAGTPYGVSVVEDVELLKTLLNS